MTSNRMRHESSIYLDLLRSGAALLVFLGHLSWSKLSGGFLWQLQPLGHHGVVVFFVLSGFVIQHVASTREQNFTDYTIARLARLYSVVLPALLLTVACDAIGRSIDPLIYDEGVYDHPVQRVVMSAFFLSQSWGINLASLSNAPFWSLPYEFWYYQIFGAALFLTGWRRTAWLSVSILAAGPAICMYFPIWLFGVMAYRAAQSLKPEARFAIALFWGSALIQILLMEFELRGVFARNGSMWFPPVFSPVDYLIGMTTAVHIFASQHVRMPMVGQWKKIALVAGSSFSLYLYHLPLLHLFAAIMPSTLPAQLRALVLAVSTLATVWVLSQFTEKKKAVFAHFLRGIVRVSPGGR